MKKLALAALSVAALAASTPASADWRFTRWGMTPEEVQAAGGSQVVPSGKKSKDVPLIIKGPFLVGEVKFDDVWFIFKDGKLDTVALHAKMFREQEIAQALAAAFGEPSFQDRQRIGGSVFVSTRTYRDTAKGNAVELRCLGDCTVTYRALDQGF